METEAEATVIPELSPTTQNVAVIAVAATIIGVAIGAVVTFFVKRRNNRANNAEVVDITPPTKK